MSESGGNSSMPNGSGHDPMQRLASFKPPRDLSLGGVKPSKKVFTPNLNVSRNKNKSGLPTVTRDRSNDRGKKDRNNDKKKNLRNGPSIIKSSGVFSEGMGATERQTIRSSYGRDMDAVPTLQKPTMKSKSLWKVDKEQEARQIKKVMGDFNLSDDEPSDEMRFDKEAPVRLPMSDGVPIVEEKKPVDVKKETHVDTDIVSLLQGEKPTLIMLQFPDTLPGRGRSEDESAKRPGTSTGETIQENTADERCLLKDLEEGQIGKLLIHKSGRVRLALGDTMFEVSAGTKASFRQEAVSVAADDAARAAVIALGPVPHKLSLLPDWEAMLADFSL